MFTKEVMKNTGWATFIGMISSVVMWVIMHLNTGPVNPPVPPKPLPKPDEAIPIVVQEKYECEPGRTITIEPKFMGAILWSVPPQYENDVKVTPFPNNDKAVVNLYGTTPVYIAINGAYQNKEGKNVPSGVVYVKIDVKGVTPIIPPTPPNPPAPPTPPIPPKPPQPLPAPTFPDGKYKLSAFVYKNAMDSVEPSNRKVMAAEFAKNYAGVASKIAAGAFNSSKDVQRDILKDITELNQASFKSMSQPVTAWETFFSALQDNVFELYTQRKLVTKEDFQMMCEEISLGFGAVR